jgi:hypothetical protein
LTGSREPENEGRTSWIGLLVACSIGVCSGAAAAQPAAPPAGYKIEEQYSRNRPDGATTIEQYLNKETDDWKWQFWARRQAPSRSSIRSRPAILRISSSPTI